MEQGEHRRLLRWRGAAALILLVPERFEVSVPTIEQLDGPRFERLATLRHVDLVDFAAEYYWRRPTWFSRLHHATSIAMLVLIVAVAWRSWSGFDPFATQAGLAFAAFLILLLPIHEALHALGYLAVGARNLRWSWSSRGLAVYVMAHREVVASAPFAFVALVPFVVINAALFCAAVLMPKYAVFFLLAMLLHHGGTSGDWALLHFLVLHAGRPLFTYDDCDTRETFFFAGEATGVRAGLPARVGGSSVAVRSFLALTWAAGSLLLFIAALYVARQGPLAAAISAILLTPSAIVSAVGAVYVAFPNSGFGRWLDVVLPALRRPAVASIVAILTLLASVLLLVAEWALVPFSFA